jgi:RNA polymerase sigma-70 factor, ECF subfamily
MRDGDRMSSEAIACLPRAPGNTSEDRPSSLANHEEISDTCVEIGGRSRRAERGSVALTANSELSDEILMDQLRHGVKDALSLIFRRHAPAVRNVSYRILRNEAEADDLIQEVFLFIFRKADLFNPSYGSARSWIVHVTYHRAFDRRRYLTTRHYYTSEELEDTTQNLDDRGKGIPFYERSMEGIFGREVVAKFNTHLTSEQKETIELYFFEGYALKEIAERTGRSLVNVRNHYYRGLERLRKYVATEDMRSK